MTELRPRPTDSLLVLTDHAASPRLVRETVRSVSREHARAVIHAARAQADAYVAEVRIAAAAYVTRTALMHVSALSAEEERLIQSSPLGASRYQAIVDAFSANALSEIVRLGRDV